MKRPELAPWIARLCRTFVLVAEKPLGVRARARMRAQLIEQLVPVVETKTHYGVLKFYSPATMPFSRSGMKGKQILEWIDGLATDNVLWDIGANVGVHTLYAARKGMQVVAFEPEAQNFGILATNIILNGIDQRAGALNIAFNDQSGIGRLQLSDLRPGMAQHQFSVSAAPEDRDAGATGQQWTLGYAIDDFVQSFDVAFPDHIKIDVDGNELLILEGARRVFSDRRVKSAVIETRPETYASAVEFMKERGFSVSWEKGNQSGDIFFQR